MKRSINLFMTCVGINHIHASWCSLTFALLSAPLSFLPTTHPAGAPRPCACSLLLAHPLHTWVLKMSRSHIGERDQATHYKVADIFSVPTIPCNCIEKADTSWTQLCGSGLDFSILLPNVIYSTCRKFHYGVTKIGPFVVLLNPENLNSFCASD